MKVFALIAASTLAVVSAQTPACDIAKLGGVIGSDDGKTCQANAGYSVLSLKFPEGDVLNKLCAEPTCKTFLAAMTAAVPTECLFQEVPVKSSLIDKFKPACDALAGSASTPAPGATTAAPEATTKKPETTTAAPDATTKAPEATTAAPDATTEAPEATTEAPEAGSESSSGSGTDIDELDDETSAPAASKTSVPTPAPTSGAATVVATASAVVVAVAASLL